MTDTLKDILQSPITKNKTVNLHYVDNRQKTEYIATVYYGDKSPVAEKYLDKIVEKVKEHNHQKDTVDIYLKYEGKRL
jgi:hypothetical protein